MGRQAKVDREFVFEAVPGLADSEGPIWIDANPDMRPEPDGRIKVRFNSDMGTQTEARLWWRKYWYKWPNRG